MASENEQDVRETLADIERDLRDRADCAERHGDRETNNDGVAMLLRSIADRIEAAWKRERDRLMSEPRSWEECVDRAMKAKENSDVLY